jgi:hypothetical protein
MGPEDGVRPAMDVEGGKGDLFEGQMCGSVRAY